MGRVRSFGVPAQGAIRLHGDNPADGDTVTIGDKTFEFDDDDAVTEGNILVTIAGSTALSTAALLAAILANPPSPGITAAMDPVDTAKVIRLRANAPGAAGNVALSCSMTDVADTIVSGASLLGGENPGDVTMARGEYTVTALDVAAASVEIPTGLASPRFVQTERYRAGELLEAVTGVRSVNAGQIRHDFAGATDLAENDVIVWLAFE